jgi:hypothetical protein
MRPTRATEGPRRDVVPHPLPGIFLLFALAALSSCFQFRQSPVPEPESPIPGFDASQYQAHKLIAALAERDKALDSMQTPAVMEYTAGTQHVKAREDIVVRRPDNLRVAAMSPFGVALLLAAQGADLQIFEPGENRFSRGAATAETLYRYVRIPMAPADAVGLLMGLAPRDFALAGAADSISIDGAMTVVGYGNPSSGIRQLGFTNGNLTLVREIASDGRVIYEVRYSNYHDIGGVMFPYLVDAEFPTAQSHVTFRYLRPIVNGNVPASTFVLTPAPGATQMNLGMAEAGVQPGT